MGRRLTPEGWTVRLVGERLIVNGREVGHLLDFDDQRYDFVRMPLTDAVAKAFAAGQRVANRTTGTPHGK